MNRPARGAVPGRALSAPAKGPPVPRAGQENRSVAKRSARQPAGDVGASALAFRPFDLPLPLLPPALAEGQGCMRNPQTI